MPICGANRKVGTGLSSAAALATVIRKAIENLANETDAARQSELFRDYLKASAAFHDCSWCNQMLIWRQRPDATYVGGFNTWLKCGRYVRKGEKGIAILARCSSMTKVRLPMAMRARPRASGSRSSTSSKDYLVICGRACARSIDPARATLERSLDSSKHIIAQLRCTPQRSLRPG